MAICAAASQHGIETIDIQHGKQGKYQPMYSGWTRIPSDGYALIPYKFWCWGEPSCKHIMSSCPDRKKHLPFVGGYPWIDYYKNNMTYESHQAVQAKITILFTMQAHITINIDRIPNFIIDFLTISKSKDIHLIFRIHPNDHDGYTYCQKRLRGINQESYTIDDGKKNLYELFNSTTHHITAYSSCCYEARLFNIPTLLFGEESKEIYDEEISSKIFSWTDNNVEDICEWLASDSIKNLKAPFTYIDNR